jgi:hypothetical protein
MLMPTRAYISYRISPMLWLRADRRTELLAMLAARRDTVDEVAFFTGYTHPPLPLAVLRERAALLGEIMPAFRALGLVTGINHLATIGHLNENLEGSLNEPWTRMTDIDGHTAAGCYCPSDPDFRAYAAESYAALAAVAPDFIWVDDDVRLQGNGPVGKACFCDRCLARFAAETGTYRTRETLRAALNAPDALPLRARWVAHNRALLADLLALVRTAVDTVNPALPLGLMTGEIDYSGNGYDVWAAALAGPRGVPVKMRPGGGFYTDDGPGGLLGKAHSIGRQVAPLPATVTDIQSEHENFPYQRLKKSVAVFTAEIAAYIGAGCTGTALNVNGISGDPFDEYLPLFDAVRARRPFYDAAVVAFGRSAPEGLWSPNPPDAYAALHTGGDWFSAPSWGGMHGHLQELTELGLPMAYAPAGARVTVLAGDGVYALSREALLQALAGGVLLDGAALAALHALGCGEYTGFAIAGERRVDTQELLSADPLNGRFGGWMRDCRPSFWPQPSYVLQPLSGDARALSTLIDFAGTAFGPASGVFENALGGRVAVFGYYPWASLQSLAKASQVRAVARWLARETLPAWVPGFHKAAVWARRDAQGRPALLVLNASIDAADALPLAVLDAPALTVTAMDGTPASLPQTGTDGAYGLYALPHIDPWQAVLVTG